MIASVFAAGTYVGTGARRCAGHGGLLCDSCQDSAMALLWTTAMCLGTTAAKGEHAEAESAETLAWEQPNSVCSRSHLPSLCVKRSSTTKWHFLSGTDRSESPHNGKRTVPTPTSCCSSGNRGGLDSGTRLPLSRGAPLWQPRSLAPSPEPRAENMGVFPRTWTTGRNGDENKPGRHARSQSQYLCVGFDAKYKY